MPFYLFKVILCNILLVKSLQIPLTLIWNGNRNSDFDKLSLKKKMHWYYFCVFIFMVWQIRLKRGAEGSSPIVFLKTIKSCPFLLFLNFSPSVQDSLRRSCLTFMQILHFTRKKSLFWLEIFSFFWYLNNRY